MRPFLAAALFASLASTQQPALSAVAVSPLTCTAATPTASATQTVPAGPLGPIGVLATGLGATTLTGDLQWWLGNSNTELSFTAHHNSTVWPAAPSGSTVTADYDFRLSVTPPSAGAIELDVALVVIGSAGVPLPNVLVDVGDDSVNEFTQASPAPLQALVPVGPAPLPIRVRLQSLLTIQGVLDIDLRVSVRPAFVMVAPAIGSCVVGATRLTVQPTFDGISVRSLHAHVGSPVALVFGLFPQPTVIPSPVAVPCLLLPRPDFIAIVWDQTPLTLPVPTTVWPIFLWTQGVELPFGGWLTTEGYTVRSG